MHNTDTHIHTRIHMHAWCAKGALAPQLVSSRGYQMCRLHFLWIHICLTEKQACSLSWNVGRAELDHQNANTDVEGHWISEPLCSWCMKTHASHVNNGRRQRQCLHAKETLLWILLRNIGWCLNYWSKFLMSFLQFYLAATCVSGSTQEKQFIHYTLFLQGLWCLCT